MKKVLMVLAVLMSPIAAAGEYKIAVPSDPKAEYTVIEKGESGGLKTIVTKRVGSSGTSYSERAYDCANRKVKYLGSGETFEQMKSSPSDKFLSDISPESIADYVWQEACR